MMINMNSVRSFVKHKLFRKSAKYFIVMCISLPLLALMAWQYSSYRLTHPQIIFSDNITSSILKDRLLLSNKWYVANYNLKNGNVFLSYDILHKIENTATNMISQLNSLTTFADIDTYLGMPAVENRMLPHLTNILQYQVTNANYAYIEYAGHAYISNNAYLVDAFLISNHTKKTDYVTLFANSLLAAQQEDGSYALDLNFPSYNGKEINTFPGKVMESLMAAYIHTKNPIYINSVIKAYPYYKNYWYAHKDPVAVIKLTPGLVSLYNETKNIDVYNTLIHMNNYLINNQVYDTPDVYEIGHFKSRAGRPVSVYIESLNLVYPILTDSGLKQRYKYAIQMGIQNILATQYQDRDLVFYPPQFRRHVIGGFVEHVGSMKIDLDNTAHGAKAILMTLRNNIFP